MHCRLQQKCTWSQILPLSLASLAIVSIVLVYLAYFSLETSRHLSPLERPEVKIPLPEHLNIANKIYVVSLANRRGRRKDMERLRVALGLQWSYIDALPANSDLVRIIMNRVERLRSRAPHILNETDSAALDGVRFSWPPNLDNIARSTREIEMWSSGDGLWDLPSGFMSTPPYRPIACATGNYNITQGPLPEYMILTSTRVACWHSHLIVIHKIANDISPDGSGVAIILEDDVDMEKDIHQQTRSLWPSLPDDWDVVFLGHCWSDEGRGLPLLSHILSETAHRSSRSRLHASTSPKCTHAYALSRIGARRLLLHLRYPPFAYSRAIDQAFSWLVESGRLKSFSVVPSLVVQRKIAESDVMVGKGTGSKWKDTLTHGVLGGTA
ncbi:hypothetical protein BDZ97DRAFT_1781035 [Flammula alnicola]|nr:hypothetical protein BDZ97DRAFT_1781035 [Flammula alnicola]